MPDFQIVKLVDPMNVNTTIINIPSGLVPRGTYAAGTDYSVGDAVNYLGSSYVMFVDAAAGTLPTDETKWQLIAEKGANGDPGVVQAVVAGTSVAVDNTDPANPVVSVDLSGKVDKIAGKGLSTEDYSTAEKSKLAGIEAGADVTDATNVAAAGAVMTEVDPVFSASEAASFAAGDKTKLDGIAAGAEVNVNADWTAVSGDAVISNKPTLGTASAQDVGAFATAAQGSLADSALQDIAGQDLSTADNTTSAFITLADVPAAQTQSDWNQTTNTEVDFIKNKPTIPSAYTLPTAEAAVLGGVKIGDRLSIAAGVLSADVQTVDVTGKLNIDQTTPQTTVGTFTFPLVEQTGKTGTVSPLIFEGDSLTYGTGGSQSYSVNVKTADVYQHYMYGIGSQTLAEILAKARSTTPGTGVDILWTPLAQNNVIVIWAGTNDLNNGKTGVGTITNTASSKNVVGTGTDFTTRFLKGDCILIGSEYKTVDTITDDTHLATTTNITAAHATATAYISIEIRTIFRDLVSYCLDRRAKGFKVLVLTMIDRQGAVFGNYAFREAYNKLITNRWSTFADGMVDLSTDPHIGLKGTSAIGGAEAAYWVGDGVHLSDAGYEIVTQKVTAGLANMFEYQGYKLFNGIQINPLQYSEGTITQASGTITGTGTTFTDDMIGSIIVGMNDGNAQIINDVTDSTTIQSASSRTLASQPFRIYKPGFYLDPITGYSGFGTFTPQSKGSFRDAFDLYTSGIAIENSSPADLGNISMLNLKARTGYGYASLAKAGAITEVTGGDTKGMYFIGTNPGQKVGVGTVSCTADSDVITGSGTDFTTSLRVGDPIRLGTQTSIVKSITSDTEVIATIVRIASSTNVAYTTYGTINRIWVDSYGNVSIGVQDSTSLFNISQKTAGPGKVSNTAGGTTVTGTLTKFTNTFKVGDTITIVGQTVAISAIANDTSMTTAAITNANSGVLYTLVGGKILDIYGNKKAVFTGTVQASNIAAAATVSGENTGDETETTIKTALGITTLSGANTGDQTSLPFGTPADGGYQGLTKSFTAGEALSAGDLLYIYTDGTVKKAKADATTTLLCIGLATASASSAAAVVVLLEGIYRNDALYTLTVGSGLAGGIVYVSDATAGAGTQTVPGTGLFVQIVGTAIDSNTIRFSPSKDWLEL